MAGTGTPFFLYPTGAAPVTVTGGVRSLFAFWAGGACSVGEAPPPTTGGGAGRPRKSPERRNLYQHRPNYDAVAEAYREAEERARELEAKKRKKALAALKIAEDAIEEARESRSQVNLAQLTGALEATAKARAVLDIVERARRSADIARLLMEEMQNEEEAEMLLLTH